MKKFFALLIFILPIQKSYAQQNLEVAALGAGMAAILIGTALAEEQIAEQLEARALDHLLSKGTTGAINVTLVQRTFNDNKALRNGASGTGLTFLVTRFDPETQIIQEKRILLFLVRNRAFNMYGPDYQPYLWFDFNVDQWKGIVKESLKSISPYYSDNDYEYLYEKTKGKGADLLIKDLNQTDQGGVISQTTLDLLVVTNEFDKIKKDNLSYYLTGDSYIIRDLTVDGENLKIFNNEDFIGLYSETLDCHSLLQLKDLSFVNSFMFDL